MLKVLMEMLFLMILKTKQLRRLKIWVKWIVSFTHWLLPEGKTPNQAKYTICLKPIGQTYTIETVNTDKAVEKLLLSQPMMMKLIKQ